MSKYCMLWSQNRSVETKERTVILCFLYLNIIKTQGKFIHFIIIIIIITIIIFIFIIQTFIFRATKISFILEKEEI